MKEEIYEMTKAKNLKKKRTSKLYWISYVLSLVYAFSLTGYIIYLFFKEINYFLIVTAIFLASIICIVLIKLASAMDQWNFTLNEINESLGTDFNNFEEVIERIRKLEEKEKGEKEK